MADYMNEANAQEAAQTSRVSVDELKRLLVDGELLSLLDALPEGPQRDRRVNRIVDRLVDEATRERLRRDRIARGWRPPDDYDHGSLGDLLVRPTPEVPFLVDQLQGRDHNVGLTGQYKVGKTTTLCTYAVCLADDLPFLGRPTHLAEGRSVGWLNLEMNVNDLLAYLRPLGVRQINRIFVLNLRGLRLPLLGEPAFDWLKQWLVQCGVDALVVDSWRRLCASCGVSENKNEEVEPLTERIDQLKREAGVSTAIVTAHTPRERLTEGEERARGATAFDDWQDVRWVQTRQGRDRFITIDGRGVDRRERQLAYDPATHRVDATDTLRDRRDLREREIADRVVAVVILHQSSGENDCLSTNKLLEQLRRNADVTHNTDELRGAIGRAVADKRIHWVPNGQARCYRIGPRPR